MCAVRVRYFDPARSHSTLVPLPLYPSSMKTLLRTLLSFALIVWLGAEIFFPIVAAITFNTLRPDTHTAGTIVGQLLRILHGMGLVAGMVALAVLALAPAWGIYKPRAVLAPMVLLVVMIAATVYSQFGIIPAMERDRMAAGGAIETADIANPTTVHFNKLHNAASLWRRRFCCWGWRRWCWWRRAARVEYCELSRAANCLEYPCGRSHIPKCYSAVCGRVRV